MTNLKKVLVAKWRTTKIANLSINIAFLLSLSVMSSNVQSESGYSLMLISPSNLKYNSYHSYGIEIVNVPEFLRGYIIEEFENVFEERGLTRNDNANELRVICIYKYTRLDAVQTDINLPIEGDPIEGDVHYKEVISIDIFETDTGYRILRGKISRILSISPLDYSLDDRNQHDLQSAFRRLLADF